MNQSIGVDLIEVSRIKNAIEKWGERFTQRIFTKQELIYASKFKYPEQHLSARFAVKEAVYKALPDELKPKNWTDIEIVKRQTGKPYCLIEGKDFSDKLDISISHTKDYAIANAIFTHR